MDPLGRGGHLRFAEFRPPPAEGGRKNKTEPLTAASSGYVEFAF